MTEDRYSAQLLSTLPYELTNGQKQVWNEIRSDMSGATAMSRLVQGDVGSGKTVLAVLALLLAISNGYQGAYMAPTEVLARQHYEKISSLLKDFPVKVGLLVGSMKESEKRTMRTLIEDGEIDLIIGTHALIQESVNYHDLGLVITDEQHRFGVRQREMLARKGRTPHVLVMSATPIPRTLALILYGDLDISLLKELPGNRQKIRNCVIDTGKRETAYRFIGSQLLDGHQVYVICPMIEPAENMDGEDVISYAEHLKDIFPKTTVGILHGQMKGDEKSAVMTAFQKNEIGILVSTTVVEVGVDVPNATVMMIENAERFGLSTLHQLRGRVGRGSAQSYCILVSGSEQEHARKRLDMLAGTNDGFEIAEYDLKMRGPGEFCGERQSGLLAFGIADIYEDSGLLSAASQDASDILKRDPELELPEHLALKERLRLYETETLTL